MKTFYIVFDCIARRYILSFFHNAHKYNLHKYASDENCNHPEIRYFFIVLFVSSSVKTMCISRIKTVVYRSSLLTNERGYKCFF